MSAVQNRDDIVVFDEMSAAIHEEPSGITDRQASGDAEGKAGPPTRRPRFVIGRSGDFT